MIDKEKVREAVDKFTIDGVTKEQYSNENLCVLLKLAELYLAGKICEPVTREEIEKILKTTSLGKYTPVGIRNHPPPQERDITLKNYRVGDRDISKLANALIGNVAKGVSDDKPKRGEK